MADGSHEPVLVSLMAPARRNLVDGLVRGTKPGNRDPASAEDTVTQQNSGARSVDADLPDVEIADFLAEIAHSDAGFVARTSRGERALAIVAATAAALCGEDIRAALGTPDIAFLTSLKPPAIEAVRTVLLAIETDSPGEVGDSLAVLIVADSPR